MLGVDIYDEMPLPQETIEHEGFGLVQAAAICVVFGVPLLAIIFGKGQE